MKRIPRFARRTAVFVGSLAASTLLATAVEAAVPTVHLETVVSDLRAPTAIVHDGTDRLFVAELEGTIRIFEDGAFAAEPFLDISDLVGPGNVHGLLSVAFPPDFATSGYFFVTYTDLERDLVLSRFSVGASPSVADPTSERILLEIPQPVGNHNGGQLAFGAAGLLYLATGDGGGIHDPFCNSQNPASLLGKMLRLDVRAGSQTSPYYSIPPDNPFLGQAGVREEIWALGLRNPWRFSFDRLTGDLFIPDVGEDQREEINREISGAPGGHNYGWKVLEGTVCRSAEGCDTAPPACDSGAYTAPIFEYDHSEGDCSITGGSVYRGNAIPGLVASYVYGDFCTGKLWAARRTVQGWSSERLTATLPGVQTFGEDFHGEIYLADATTLYRLAGAAGPCAAGDTALCLRDARFRVSATWRTPTGATGSAQAIPLADDTGAFWFFDPANFEILVKVLRACGFNDRYWVFAGGLTNVAVQLEVMDTKTGASVSYTNPLGQAFAPIQDTDAFATCP